MIQYTIFPDVLAATCEARSVNWSEIVRLALAPAEYPTKAAMPLVKLATFGNVLSPKGSLRHDANMVRVYGVEGDYDAGEVSIEEAEKRLSLAGVEALIYPTPRNTPDAPRWRVLAPLANPCEPAGRRANIGLLNAALDGILAKESFTDSQSFYFGRLAGAPYDARHVRGMCIDEMELFFDPVFPASVAAVRNERDDLARATTLAAVDDDTMRDLRSATLALGAHRAEPHTYEDLWLPLMQAYKSLAQAGRAAEALELAHLFCAKGSDYDRDAVEKKWRQLDPHTLTYRTIFAAAAEDGWVNPRKAKVDPARPDGGRVDMTDAGNVNALFEKTAGDLRFIVERKCWMRWDGCTWFVCESGVIARDAALQVAEMWRQRAKDVEAEADKASGDDRKQILKVAESYRAWVAKCRNRNGLDNLLSSAGRDPRFAVSVAQLDQDRWALGVANGVVDLRTGQLRESGREDLITKRSPYRFNPEAVAPRLQQFIDEITSLPDGPNNAIRRPKYAAYLRRAIGYWATGAVNEHKMFAVSGEGSNGKSVLFDVLSEVLGPYCVQIPPEAMMATSRDVDGERPTPYARSLAGARLAFGSEAREGQKLNAAWVKKQTGDAKLTARGLHENAFTFSVTHKLALLTNHEPSLDHMDEATRGRLHVLPFDRRWNRPGLPSRDPSLPDGDKHLMQALLAEADGILAEIVRGAVSYAREGLDPPAEVADKTIAYFEQQDPFAQWLATMQRCAAKVGTAASVLLGYFHSWCSGERVQNPSPSTPHAFAKALDAAGIEKARTSTGAVWGLQQPDPAEF